jgi:uncharacterized membrane protein
VRVTSWVRHARSRLIAGLLVVLPFVATIWIVVLLFNLVDGVVARPAMRLIGIDEAAGWRIVWLTRLISVVLVAISLYVLGLLATNVAGRFLLRAFDRAAGGIPVAGSIYRGTKQLMDALGAGSSSAFRRCVMIEYPRKGVWTLAFVTNEKRVTPTPGADRCLTLFVPTTPNPTSGYFLIVPERDCIPLAISVEDGVKMIVSAGIVLPGAMAVMEERPEPPGEGE